MKPKRLFLVNLGQRRPLHPLVTPPLGIMYLAAYIRQRHPVVIELCNQKLSRLSDKGLVRKIINFNPHIVGISAMTHTGKNLGWIINQLHDALPLTWIIIGGPHATAMGEQLIDQTRAHAVVVGEGEVPFSEVVKAYPDLKTLESVHGIITRHCCQIHSLIHKIKDLDTLPLPAYDLIDIRKYWKEQSMPPIPRRKYITLLSSRGCPYQCSYCHHIFGKTFRQHSPERLVDEISYYQKKYHIDDFEFVDDIFNLDPSFVINFCQQLLSRNIHIKFAFPNGVRGDILTQETIEALTDAGMYFCAFAIESGSQRIQKQIRKNLNIEKCLQNICMTQKRGVYCHGFAMLGFPGEIAQEMQMTIDVVAKSCLHTASFFTVTPLPGSEMFAQITRQQSYSLNNIDYKEFSDVTMNLSHVDNKQFLKLKRSALQQVMLYPGRITRVLRDFPQPVLLPIYLPEFIRRVTQGVLYPSQSISNRL